MHTRRARSVVLAAHAVLVASTTAACTSGDTGDPARSSADSASTTGRPTSAAPTASSGTPTLESLPASRAQASLQPGFDVSYVGRSASTTVLVGDTDVAGYGADGKKRWAVRAPKPGDKSLLQVAVDGDVTVISWTVAGGNIKHPPREVVRAVDTRTGRSLWKDRDVSAVSVLAGATYTSTCQDGLVDVLGACTVSARDPRTGSVRWSTPAYAGASVDTPQLAEDLAEDVHAGPLAAPRRTGPVLVISYRKPNVTGSVETAHDPASGRALGPQVPAPYGVFQAPGVRVVNNQYDETPTNGCRITLRGTDASGGSTRWKRTFDVGRLPAVGEREEKCAYLSARQVTPTLIAARTTGAVPILVDLRTGRTVWTGTGAGAVLLVTDTLIAVQAGQALDDPDGRITFLDRKTSKTVWTVPAVPNVRRYTVQAGSRLVLESDDAFSGSSQTETFALADGKPLVGSVGKLVGYGSDWFAVRTSTGADVYPLG